jgi:hypothetical protein
MKWINEKTVQGDPDDTKNYFIPKEEYNIPLVNEGIQEGRKLVYCKDCKYWVENKTTRGSYRNCIFSKTMMRADDFCSRGEHK